MDAIPDPAAIPVTDADARQIHFCVLVVGDAARRFVDAVHTRVSGSRRADGSEGEAPFHYLGLHLGEIRGWKTDVHFYGFGEDARLVHLVERYAARADGAVLAESGEVTAGEVTNALARSMARFGQRTPVAAWGGSALARRWSSLADYEAMHAGEASEAEVVPVLKALTAAMLARLGQGQG